MKIVKLKLISKTFHITIIALLFCVSNTYAQKDLVTRIDKIQDLQFGTFVNTGSAGGTVEVSWNGIRTSTGSIVLLGNDFRPAIFEVTLNGNIKKITNNTLTISYVNYPLNAAGGGLPTLSLEAGGPLKNRDVGNYVSTGRIHLYTTTITVGARLTIPGNAISDTYAGTFDITVVNK